MVLRTHDHLDSRNYILVKKIQFQNSRLFKILLESMSEVESILDWVESILRNLIIMVFIYHILRFLDIYNDSFFNLNKKINILIIENRKEFFSYWKLYNLNSYWNFHNQRNFHYQCSGCTFGLRIRVAHSDYAFGLRIIVAKIILNIYKGRNIIHYFF